DAAPRDEQEDRPDPVEAEGLVGAAEEEQQAEAGEGEAEGQGDGVELVAAHQGSFVGGGGGGGGGRGACPPEGGVGGGRPVGCWSKGPTSWKAGGSLIRRTSITP